MEKAQELCELHLREMFMILRCLDFIFPTLFLLLLLGTGTVTYS